MFIYPEEGLWFLWVLAWINLLIYIGQKISNIVKSDLGYVAIAIILNLLQIITKFSLFGFNLIVWYYFFFVVGYRVNYYWEKRSADFKISTKILGLIFFANLILFWEFPVTLILEKPVFETMHENSFSKLSILYEKIIFLFLKCYLIQLTGIISIITISSFLRKKLPFKISNINSQFFSFIGKKTLEIYAIHIIIVYDLQNFIICNSYIDAIVKFFLSIVVSIFIGKLASTNKITKFLFLGKISKK